MFKQILIFWLSMIPALAFADEGHLVRYVALGDSYTIGTGAALDESWPAVCAAHLRQKGVPIELVGNLGRNGWTSENLIDDELPQLKELKPRFCLYLDRCQ